ncbi:uncharacterized protein Dwil_GK21708 [Drosophila willistoni]|uniref:GK21708 n=1 Tax=Drosophila willistoni TaxID=7260 RepID=B4MPI4_DROWI|nr:protein panoramix [Drosophila willistoni]EDW74023.1 uncharacterized protein Dwil_GK21708 [Drosophila willistoni]
MDVNLKIEPSEHPKLSDNDTTPLREEPATSPKIFVSNATSTGTDAGWESDDAEENVVIPKRDPDDNYFDDLVAPRQKDVKDENPPKLEDANIDWDGFDKDWDVIPNGFTKREHLDDMDLGNGPETQQAGEASPELQALLDQEALLKKLTEQAGEEEASTSSHSKKRKKHKKNKSRHHEERERIRSPGPSRDNNEDKRVRRHSPSPDRESRRSVLNRSPRRRSPSLPREDEYRREERSLSGSRAGISNNNEGERTYKRRRSSDAQRDDFNGSKRSRDSSTLSYSKNHSKKCEPESKKDFEELKLRDDEKGRLVRLVDPSKLIQAAPEPQPPKLTAREKQRANVERTRLTVVQMELESSKAPKEEFLMVDTISKMPISLSFMTQDIFENPSPLQNNFNVSYNFNSISGTYINISKWGLEALPKDTVKILNILGINSDSLKKIEANTVTPQRILKLRKLAAENGELDVKLEDLMSSGTGLYRTMGTQTIKQPSNNTKDMGTQTKPMKENAENYAIWQDPKFDIINLTQTQTNVMFALKELSECMPSQLWAEQLYKPLKNALFIKRNAIKDPRLTRNSYN